MTEEPGGLGHRHEGLSGKRRGHGHDSITLHSMAMSGLAPRDGEAALTLLRRLNPRP